MATARKKLIASCLVSAAVDTRQASVEKFSSRDEDGFPYPYEEQSERLVTTAQAACMYLPETMRPGVERALICMEVVEAARETGAWLDKIEEQKLDGKVDEEPRVTKNWMAGHAIRVAAVGVLIACGKWTCKKEEA